MKKTNRQKNSFVYLLIGGVVRLFLHFYFRFHLEIDDDVARLKKDKEAFVLLSAHPSEVDAIVLLAATYPNRARFVAGAQQLYKGLQGKILRLMNVIPKKQFVADLSSVKEMIKTIRDGQILGLLPEGRVSPDGTPSPNYISTAKLLKKLGAPVVMLVPHGTYFVKPSYNWKALNKGNVSGKMYLLFSPEEVQSLSPEEILAKLNIAFDYNACEELRGSGFTYGSKKMQCMKNVSNILYRCPSCGALYTISDDGESISCRQCGLKAKLCNDGFIRDFEGSRGEESFPDNVAAWNKIQKDFERSRMKDDDVFFTLNVTKSMLKIAVDKDYKGSEDGTLQLTKDRFIYKDKTETIDLPLSVVPGVSADYLHGYISFYQGDDIRRFILTNPQDAVRFVNCLMILKEKELNCN